jgi:hypothetical protein
VNFGAANCTVDIDCRNAFSFDPVLAAETVDQQCVFANTAPFGNGFGRNDFADDFRGLV